ncbi:ring-cleaving dioxygenase [Anaerolineales bacterium]
MQVHGIHHVTSISAQISENLTFYTQILGLRLVKKTVNQDDVRAYHLFYADKVGSPGTDITFFDWPQIPVERRGSDSICLTVFRVNGAEALHFWLKRFEDYGVKHEAIENFAEHSILRFEDSEGQRLMLMDDQGAAYTGEIWSVKGIPDEYTLRGFYAVALSVAHLDPVQMILTEVLSFREVGRFPDTNGQEVIIYEMDNGGPGQQIWLYLEPDLAPAQSGAGGTHHVAFRVKDEAQLDSWLERVKGFRLPVSKKIDRFYFQSIYFRISRGILFEIATDGPGFAADEAPDALGQTLALPPFLEANRAEIEAGLKPIQSERK